MGGGHYTANAVNKNTRNWYTFDDRFSQARFLLFNLLSSVSKITPQSINASSAYILFYVRRDVAEKIYAEAAQSEQPQTTSAPAQTSTVPAQSTSEESTTFTSVEIIPPSEAAPIQSANEEPLNNTESEF